MKWLPATTMLLLFTALTLSPAAGQSRKEKAKGEKVEIVDLKYRPAKVTVKAGETVVWRNTDDRDHTVVAKDKSFDSGKIAAGDTFEHTFEKPGKYEYGCNYHPRMRAVVEVTE